MAALSSKIGAEIGGLPDGQSVLVASGGNDSMSTVIKIMKLLTAGGFGVYMTANQPYSSLKEALPKAGVNTSRMFFIDCVTRMVEDKPGEDARCIFVGSPRNLTDISISITEALEAVGGKRFLFVDNLSALQTYNSVGSLAKFSHFLVSKIKILNVRGVFMLGSGNIDRNLLRQVSQFCDRTVTI